MQRPYSLRYQDTQRVNHPHGRRYHAVMSFMVPLQDGRYVRRRKCSGRHFESRRRAQIYAVQLMGRYKALARAAQLQEPVEVGHDQ